ncbi:MAG: leucyl aminopeptidase [Acidobacteriota bacterium]|nr:leucyl aminopeptidase [Acidobacteriota bacterium]
MTPTETTLLFEDPSGIATPMLAVFAVDLAPGEDAEPLIALMTTSSGVSNAARKVLGSGEFKAGLGETLLLHAPEGIRAERLLIVGMGKVRRLTTDAVRKAAGVAVRSAKPRGLRQLTIALPEDHALDDEALESLPVSLTTRAVVEGAVLANPEWDTYKSDRKDRTLTTLQLVAPATERATHAEIRRGHAEGLIVANAQNTARSLVNEPGNVLTPTELGLRATEMCLRNGLKCEVHSTELMQQLGMNAFLAVARGSSQPPALIVMRYEPQDAPADGPVLGLVGKGITFDTGGISLKPADGMEKMKYDMAGAAAMIGAMQAIAQLKPRVRVTAIVCSTENMPDGNAYKPGDVVQAMSGKTIEIINTDCEGRMVLADGLHYARTLGCTHLINAATLTGACVVALGMVNAGAFSNDETTWQRFDQALRVSGEKFWRLPCTDDYRDLIKSPIADIRNQGIGRWGGATTAAMFLKEFVGDTPWVHLDIAGCAWNEENKAWLPTGPTGIAVRSIVEWVRSYAV